jgi:hypothetical protein
VAPAALTQDQLLADVREATNMLREAAQSLRRTLKQDEVPGDQQEPEPRPSK